LVKRETGGDPKVLYYVGRLRWLALDNDAAISILRKIDDAPPFPGSTFYLGCAYLAVGEIDDAILMLQRAPASAPRDYRISHRLARAYDRRAD
jgi:hypothetical protein